jgi:hypothetical protein
MISSELMVIVFFFYHLRSAGWFQLQQIAELPSVAILRIPLKLTTFDPTMFRWWTPGYEPDSSPGCLRTVSGMQRGSEVSDSPFWEVNTQLTQLINSS